MRRCVFVFVLLASVPLLSQDTISVDATPVMHVCSEKNPASSGPCATPPKAISKINPSYPEKARRARLQGAVTLGATIGKDGSAHDIHVVTSQGDDLDKAAISAVNQWKFEPGTYQGNPVDVEMSIQINFRLETNASPEHEAATNTNSDQIRNLYTDADEARHRGDYRTAVALARRLTTLAPQYGAAWNLLGMSLHSLN